MGLSPCGWVLPLALCWLTLSTPKSGLKAYGWAGGIFPTEINRVQCLTEGQCKRCIIHEVGNLKVGAQTARANMPSWTRTGGQDLACFCLRYYCIHVYRIVYFRHYRPIKYHTFGHCGVIFFLKAHNSK